MSNNFNSIDWVSLGTPHMAHWLEGMISYNTDAREQAYDDFYDSGVIELNKATPYVIPFLIDFLALQDVPRKRAILQLLIVLAGEASAYKDHPKKAEIAASTLAKISIGISVFEHYKEIDDTKKLATELLTYFEV